MEELLITSTTNPMVKSLARLQKRAGREEQGLFMVEGLRNVDGLLSQGWQPQRYLLDKSQVVLHALARCAAAFGQGTLGKNYGHGQPSGHRRRFNLPLHFSETWPAWKTSRPWSWSTSATLAMWARFCAALRLLLGNRWSSSVAPTPLRQRLNAAVGSLAALRLWRCASTCDPELLKQYGKLLALVPRDGQRTQQIDLTSAPFVCVGNEAHGLPPEWIRAADCG